MGIRTNYWINSGFFSLLQRSSTFLIGFITFLILIRILPVDAYGVWILYYSIISFSEMLREGFLKNPLIKFHTETKDAERKHLVSSSYLLNVIFSLLFVTSILVFRMPVSRIFDAPELANLMLILCANVLLGIFMSHFENLFILQRNFKVVSYAHMLNRSLLLIILIVYFFLGWTISVRSIAMFNVFTYIPGIMYMIICLRNKLQIVAAPKKKYIVSLSNYGKYTFMTNLSSIFLRNIDMWMLGGIIGPKAVAIYNPAIRISNLFEIPMFALSSVFFPKAVERINEEGKIAAKSMYEKSVAYLVAILIPFTIAIIAFSDQVILLVAGPDFTESSEILVITMLYGIVIPFNRQFGVILDATGKAWLNTLFIIRNAIINAILNFYLIQAFGVIGAAYATFLSFVLIMIINQIVMRYMLNISLISLCRNLFYFYPRLFSALKNKDISIL